MHTITEVNDIVDLLEPIFGDTGRDVAQLIAFVKGITDNWEVITQELQDGVEAVMLGIEKAWAELTETALDFWKWLERNWQPVLAIAYTAIVGVGGWASGVVLGGNAGGMIGGACLGPIGVPVGEIVGGAVGSWIGGVVGGAAGAAVARNQLGLG